MDKRGRDWKARMQKMPKLTLAALMVLSTAVLWAPFLLDHSADTLYRYWDGPSYVTVAYSLYAVSSPIYVVYGFGPAFYAAHLPAYPVLIRLLSLAAIGYFPAMLLATLACAIAAVLAFFELAKDYTDPTTAWGLAALFCVFPARWLIYHSVGATEPLFIAATLSSLLFFHRRQYAYAAASGALAALTRVNGILLFPALLAALWLDRRNEFTARNVAALCAIPLATAALFGFYAVNFGDFFAAFSVNQQYAKGLFSAITDFGGAQAGELTVILFGLYLAGTAKLWQQKRRTLALACAAMVVPLLFLSHNDLSRYLLPAAPLALLLAWDESLKPLMNSRPFWIAALVMAAAAYVYAWNVLPQNLMPHDAFVKLQELIG